jgi:hypothetical protein
LAVAAATIYAVFNMSGFSKMAGFIWGLAMVAMAGWVLWRP